MKSLVSTVAYVADRLKEPSTWAGAAALAVAFGLSEQEWQVYSNAIAAVAAVVAMVLKDRQM